MTKKKGLSMIGIILMAVALVGAILAVTGVFVDWIKYTASSTLLGGSTTAASTLSELADANKELGENGYEMFGAMNAFAYITMILTVVTFAVVVVGKLLDVKMMPQIGALAGILTIVSAILLIVFTCMFCSKNAAIDFGDLGKGGYSWAAGAVLAVIGSFITGLCGLVSYKK